MNKTTASRTLRKTQTAAETKLWFFLRQRRFLQFKFRRQHVIGPYIVDFVCLKKGLVIEVDGPQHIENKAYDDERTHFLNLKGYRVLRFWNNQVLQEIDDVLHTIYQVLSLSSCSFSSSALRAPSPKQALEKD